METRGRARQSATSGAAETFRWGVDVGGTKILSGLVDGTGRVVACHRMASCPEDSATDLVQRLLDPLQQLCSDHSVSVTDLVAVGLGFPGDFDPRTGALLTCPNLQRLVGSRPAALFADGFATRWGTRPRVAADNDTVVAVLGEATFGAGRGVRKLLYMTVSTGVGGARFDGGHWENLEPGLRLFPSPEQPEVCLEELAGGVHLARQARSQLSRWWQEDGEEGVARRTSVLQAGGLREGSREERLGRLTARHLGEAAAAGDPWCQTLFRRAADHVAGGLAILLDQDWGEERIVLGGAIALGVPGFIDQVRQRLRQRQALPGASAALRRFDPHGLVTAGLGEERGILGAVLLVSGVESPMEATGDR